MTASYWEIGRRIVQAEQKGKRRAGYGEQLISRLSADLSQRFGRGFSPDNLENMRQFFLVYPTPPISETPSRKFSLTGHVPLFQLPWSAYVRLMAVKNASARQFYEDEALRGGLCVRQLDRQIGSQFYERTMLSKEKVGMLARGGALTPQDLVTPDDAIKDPYVLEFLNLKDPVGLILCADKGQALARYALEGLPTKVMAANYRTVLPDAEMLQKELENARRLIEFRGAKFRGTKRP